LSFGLFRDLKGVVVVGSSSSSQVSELLRQWNAGEVAAREKLVPLIYEELRRIARRCLANQADNHTLESAALVHEAYLRLVGRSAVHWHDRVHFFAIASRLMRGILVDHARMRRATKRGGDNTRILLDETVALAENNAELDLLVLDEALTRLASFDPRQGQIVEMRFFGGLSVEDTSAALGVSPATVKREWATARLWLYNALRRAVDT
jgi:RNA polymerase sigma factor (TIGR02999 family)